MSFTEFSEVLRSPKVILGLDIGGTYLKASLVDLSGRMLCAWERIRTPRPANPDAILAVVRGIVASLPDFDAISVAFPGVVYGAYVETAPNLGTNEWRGFNLQAALEGIFERPTRVLNDAVVQGLGVVEGEGLQCVLTLGTGMGCALFRDAKFLMQLELGRHVACGDLIYDEFIGHAAYVSLGSNSWNDRLSYVIDAVRGLVNFDHLYIGGGNAQRITLTLPQNITAIPSTAGIIGGAQLWCGTA